VNVTSVDKPAWTLGKLERPPALEVVLLRQTIILSWNQFVYAEGGDDEIRVAFATHDIIVRGRGLELLLHAICANRVAAIHEPSRTSRFSAPAERPIREIIVRKLDAE
jgi:hypothetical protein